MLYKINEKPKTLKEVLLYALQQTLSVLTATILISSLCGTNIAAGMVGAGCATIIFLLLTNFKAPLFFSNSGSTVSAVSLALSTLSTDGNLNYAGVIIGGIVVCLMNQIFALIIHRLGSGWIRKLLPPVVSGTIVVVIGIHLSTFCLSYIGSSLINMTIAFITMLVTVYVMNYAKGIWKTLPFLCGAGAGIILSIIFGMFKPDWTWTWPQFAFLNADFSSLDWGLVGTIVVTFAAVNLANLGEHISDVMAVSSVVGEDLTQTVGLDKTMSGDGFADLIGCLIGGQPTTTYSESLSTIAVSGVASTFVILIAAGMTIALGLFSPFTSFVDAIPDCVFGGVALVAYGMIAKSGLNVVSNISLLSTKNSIIIAVMLTVGLSGIGFTFGQFTLSGIALSMVTGLLLNLIIKE